MNPTLEASRRSFIATTPESHFPIQNLPYGVFRQPGGAGHIGVAIGDWILDLFVVADAGLFAGPILSGSTVLRNSSLNAFMALGRNAWREARSVIGDLLHADQPRLRDDAALRARCLVPRAQVEMLLPAEIGDYTDFYSSREHATNVGTMLRGPDNALMPNWLHLPVAYHGRASSIMADGLDLHRPLGQSKSDSQAAPVFGPSRAVDFELEMGFFIGPGNPLGQPIPIEQTEQHIFGMVLVNDWSARDIQKWEYAPLGPFLAKNFGTTISPWVVTLEALEPFRTTGPRQDPEPLPYLRSSGSRTYDIHLEAWLQTPRDEQSERICATNYRHLYWNACQQLAHHASNGCNLRPGDLLASGTISGPSSDSCGSLLELTWKGEKPLRLSNGETRTYLQDNDRLTLTGWCQGDGYRVGFGTASARILPALDETS